MRYSPDLIEIGLDVYQTFQPEVYDIKKVKREYGGDMTFWGGISTQKLLPFASTAEVKKTTLDFMRIMGENGGLCCSNSCGAFRCTAGKHSRIDRSLSATVRDLLIKF